MVKSVIETALDLGTKAGGTLGATATGLRAVLDLAKRPDADLTEIKTRLVDLIDQLIQAKEAQMMTQNALLELQQEQARDQRFADEAARYTLSETDMGGLVYALKPDHKNGEPRHCLCANCFEQRQKSILQRVAHNTLGCPRCKAQVYMDFKESGPRSGGLHTRWDVLDPYR
ncbi:MAG: hypothetical protein JJU24_05260 [Natronohydrobacter sp.]|nr:hypothetical protein [Natronohydrobacter sp.]